MRASRYKLEKGHKAVYHCVTRVVGREMLLTDRCKEVLKKQIRYLSDFCGVEVITYCVMTNHFHVLVRNPASIDSGGMVSNNELLRRVRILYGKDPLKMAAYEMHLKGSDKEQTNIVRERLLKRMGDVSAFMKELKQRFSIWYNKNHHREGTLWTERFKSTLVEDNEAALRMVAAYIDLNPLRAGIVNDPKDYRWSGYGEAQSGVLIAKRGIASISANTSFDEVIAVYRSLLYGAGSRKSKSKDSVIDIEKARAVIAKGGKLPSHELLRLRVRYFTDGAVLGSEDFVKEWLQNKYGLQPSSRRKPRKLRSFGDEYGLRSGRALRLMPVG